MNKRLPAAFCGRCGVVLLHGCGGTPQTAEEFRQAVPGAMLAKTDSTRSTGAYRDVGHHVPAQRRPSA